MSETRRTFEEICAELTDAGVIPPAEIDPYILDVVTGQVARTELDVQLGFLDDPDFNAWAVTVDGADYVGINLACLPILLNAYRMLLSQHGVLPNIGDPDIEQRPFSVDAQPSALATLTSGIVFQELNDPARDAHARSLALGSFLYIVHHELAHVRNGHTSWLEKHFGFVRLSEVPEPGTPGFTMRQRQTLEFDADLAAVQSILQFNLRAEADSTTLPSRWMIPDANPWGTESDALEATALMVYVVHLFFSTAQALEEPNPFLYEHPPAVVRATYNVDQLAHLLCLRAGRDEDEVRNRTLEFLRDASYAFYQALGLQDYLKPLTEAQGRRLEAYVRSYLRCWCDLRPELDGLKRSGILAAAQPDTPDADFA